MHSWMHTNRMHFEIEFQAGEKESASHLKGQKEKIIWEKATRGASHSAAMVSVCLMLIEQCAERCNCCTFKIATVWNVSR